MKKIDLTGRIFERCTVLKYDPNNRSAYSKFICRCACGKIVSVFGQNLLRGTTKSCGCLLKEITIKISTTHGLSKTNEYKIWQGMKCRCLNKKDKAYPKYGGRGISICEEWATSFQTFFTDMGVRPNKNLSLERRDNDLGYSKSNCYWGTAKEQSDNRRITVWIEYDGIKLTQADWAKKLKINVGTLTYWLKKGKLFSEIAERFLRERNIN